MASKPRGETRMANEETRNSKILANFVAYCQSHPHERFWQALRNWSGYHFVLVAEADAFIRPTNYKDTFNWEGKGHGQ